MGLLDDLKKAKRMQERLAKVLVNLGEVSASHLATTTEDYRSGAAAICADKRIVKWLMTLPDDLAQAFRRHAPLMIWGLDILSED